MGMFLLGFIGLFLLVATVSIGTGINDGDWGRVATGTFLFALPAVATIYFLVRPSPREKLPESPIPTPQQEEERQNQLQALQAATPTAPLTSMRATVQTNTFKRADDFVFTVDMILELTETERAIIKENELDDIVLQDVPLHTKEDLQQKEADIAKHQQAFDDAFTTDGKLNHKLAEQVDTQVLADMRTARLKTTIGQLLVSPYTRVFESPHEANEYAHTLKTKLLPEMKRLIDKHGAHKKTETLQF